MISAYTYDEGSQILEVAYHRGVYRYFDVPVDVFQGLHHASPKGSYMRSLIIDQYAWEKNTRTCSPRPSPAKLST